MKLVKIDIKYIKYLKQFDNRVMDSKESNYTRPYIGIVLYIDDFIYFAPITTNRGHRVVWNRPIIFNENGMIPAISLINMIPIPNKYADSIVSDINYQANLDSKDKATRQYAWLLAKENRIISQPSFYNNVLSKAKLVYKLRINNVPTYIDICCDFKKLESASLLFKK